MLSSLPVLERLRFLWLAQFTLPSNERFETSIKTAMLRLDRIFRWRKMKARIVMMIHDSLWVEAPHEEEIQVRNIMRRTMTTVEGLRVPLEVKFE
jgi:DNA polymerase I-like protein with 3'-5' exonuclease and polymerase domains